jgi:stage IV sporulation protein FB
MKIRRVDIYISPMFFFLLIFLYILGYLTKFMLAFSAIIFHEIMHIISTALFRGSIYSVKVLPVGMNAVIEENSCTRLQRIFIYISGPCANLILFLICLIVNTYYLFEPDKMVFFISTNLWLAIFNMLPVLPLDGGKIFREILAWRIGMVSAGKYINKVSIILILIMVAVFGAFLLITDKNNFSLLLIGVYIMLSLKSEIKETVLMNLKNIIFRRSRILKKGIYPARSIVVLKSKHLGEILKAMDFDMFHIVHVLDEELGLIKVLTEQDILQAIFKYSSDMTFEELISLN